MGIVGLSLGAFQHLQGPTAAASPVRAIRAEETVETPARALWHTVGMAGRVPTQSNGGGIVAGYKGVGGTCLRLWRGWPLRTTRRH